MLGKNGLVRVYKDTIDRCNSLKRTLPKPTTQTFGDTSNDFVPPKKYDQTVIRVTNKDSIDAAFEAQKEFDLLSPIVLNMASDFKPGGGVENGARAQEECLFRRTNYFMHLNKRTTSYPFSSTQVVYTPSVAVLKNADYELYDYVRFLDFIACAGIRKPRLENGHMTKRDMALLKKKIHILCQVAIKFDHDSLILGALGCGAFACPPDDVASCFKEVLNEYSGCFKLVEFAVLSDGSNPNFKVFNETLSS
jgi:uncharacterized protein (TIGR02452 family)